MAAPPDVAPRDDPVVVELSGNITASSRGGGTLIFYPPLTGTIFAKTFLQARWQRAYLTGRITAQTRLRFYTNRAYLAGRITAQAKPFAPPLIHGPPQYGRITGQARLRLAPPQFHTSLQGRITGRSQLGLLPYTPQPPFAVSLTGRIAAQTQLRVRVRTTPDFASLSGRITGQAQTRLASGSYTAGLAGRITAATLIHSLRVMPWYPVLLGTIGGQTKLIFGPLEIQEPLPPYPEPFPTFSTLDYLNRVTSEHNQRPRYMATVAMSVDGMITDQQLMADYPGLFDLDYSVGQQEDFTGQWIGKSRWIELPAPYFSWDEEGLGWNQANWKGPLDADNAMQRLDDYHYRLLLYATVIANHWNGSIPQAYAAWDTLFKYTGLKVVIQDYGNMTMIYGLLSTGVPDITLLTLFTTGQMDLRPEGIALIAYALQPTPGKPFFAWDSVSDSVHGWDQGYWGLMLPPGTNYIPGVGTIWDVQPPPAGRGGRAAADENPTFWDDGRTVWDQAGPPITTISGALAVTDPSDQFAGILSFPLTTSFAVTEPSDWAAVVGMVYQPFTAVLAATDPLDQALFLGPVAGTLAATEPSDPAVLAGFIPATATLAASEPSDQAILVASATNPATGPLVATDPSDQAAVAGAATNPVTATFAATEPSDQAVFVETTVWTMVLAASDPVDQAGFAGTVTTPFYGLAATDPVDQAVFAGTTLIPFVALVAIEPVDQANLAGMVLPPATAALAATDPVDQAGWAGTVATPVTVALAATDHADDSVFAGTVVVPVMMGLMATDPVDQAVFAGTVQ